MDKITAIILNLKSALISRLRTYLMRKWKDHILVKSISYIGVLYIYYTYIDKSLESLLKRIEEHFIFFTASHIGETTLLIIIALLNKVLPVTKLLGIPLILLKYIAPLFVSFLNYSIILVERTIFLPVQFCKYVMANPKLVSSFTTALLCILLSKDTINTNIAELGQKDSSVTNRAIPEPPKIPLPSVVSALQPPAVPNIDTPSTLPRTKPARQLLATPKIEAPISQSKVEPVQQPLIVHRVDTPITLPRIEPIPQPLRVSRIDALITPPGIEHVLQSTAFPKINISSTLAGMDSALQPFTIPKNNVLDTLPSIATFDAASGLNFQASIISKNSGFDTLSNTGISTTLTAMNSALQSSVIPKTNLLDTTLNTGISTTLAAVNSALQPPAILKGNVLDTPPSIATFNASSRLNFQAITIPKNNVLDTLPSNGIPSTLPRTE